MSNGKNELSKRTVFLIGVFVLTFGGIILIIRNSSDNKKPTKEENKKSNPSDTPNNPPLPEQPSDKYSALIATKKELEYKINPPLAISSVGTDYNQLSETNKNSLLPGSALMTDTLDGLGGGSSPLNSIGITNIIHATPWPRDLFKSDEEFINCVVKSVQNSIILADRYKFEKLAIPLVGGGIYLGSCDPQKLAEGIFTGVINQLAKCQKLWQIIFLDWYDSKTPSKLKNVFLNEFSKPGNKKLLGRHRDDGQELAKNSAKVVVSNYGDIRDKILHGASVIVNAANTQVKFGGGISGAIAEQVGDKKKIEQKARELIDKFNSQRK